MPSISTAPSVLATPDGVLRALKSNLKVAGDYSKLSLPSGCTVPPDTDRVLKQAAHNCAERYFDDEEKQGMPMLAGTMAEFGINSRAKGTSTMISKMRRACVARGVNGSLERLGIWGSHCTANAAAL